MGRSGYESSTPNLFSRELFAILSRASSKSSSGRVFTLDCNLVHVSVNTSKKLIRYTARKHWFFGIKSCCNRICAPSYITVSWNQKWGASHVAIPHRSKFYQKIYTSLKRMHNVCPIHAGILRTREWSDSETLDLHSATRGAMIPCRWGSFDFFYKGTFF